MSTKPILKTKDRPDAEVITRHILRDEAGKIITSKSERKKARAIGLKAKAEKYEVVLTDKPFMKYKGSSDLIPDDACIESRHIIYQCRDKKSATYLEAMLLFETNAIFDEGYYNANILGSFFDRDLDGLIEE